MARSTGQERQKPKKESRALMVFEGLLNVFHLVKTVVNNKYSQGPGKSGLLLQRVTCYSQYSNRNECEIRSWRVFPEPLK